MAINIANIANCDACMKAICFGGNTNQFKHMDKLFFYFKNMSLAKGISINDTASVFIWYHISTTLCSITHPESESKLIYAFISVLKLKLSASTFFLHVLHTGIDPKQCLHQRETDFHFSFATVQLIDLPWFPQYMSLKLLIKSLNISS